MAPLVSIGLPVYNGENFVGDAINCVLSQTFSDWELIISDNASNDRTLDICREYAKKDGRIRVYELARNMGVCPNHNRVFQLSRGPFFKWIAHDDLFSPDFLEECLKALQADDRVVLAFPKLVHVDSASQLLREQVTDLSIEEETAEGRVKRLMELETSGTDVYWCQFGLIRRSVLEQTNLMGLYNGSDQTLLLEIALRGNWKQIRKGLFMRREHAAAATIRRNWSARERARFVNADDRRKLVFPYCRMLKEQLASIGSTSIPFSVKMECSVAVLKRFSSQWKYFAEEMLVLPGDALKLMRS